MTGTFSPSVSVCFWRVTSTWRRSRLRSPSESNSASTQRRCRTHCELSSNAGTICAWPFSKTGLAGGACAASAPRKVERPAATAAAITKRFVFVIWNITRKLSQFPPRPAARVQILNRAGCALDHHVAAGPADELVRALPDAACTSGHPLELHLARSLLQKQFRAFCHEFD